MSNSGPVKAWKKVLLNSNENDLRDHRIQQLNEEEYYLKLKERGINADFKKTELGRLHAMGSEDQFK